MSPLYLEAIPFVTTIWTIAIVCGLIAVHDRPTLIGLAAIFVVAAIAATMLVH